MARAPKTKPADKAEDNQPETGDQAAAETGQEPQAGAISAPADQDATPASEAKDGAAQPGAAPQPATLPEGRMVVVIGPKPGRRRIGRRFGQEPVAIPADELTGAEFQALMDDPTLAVSVIDP